MPRNTRQWARRKIEMATNNLDTAGQHLFTVAEIYRKAHPEISDTIELCLESLTLNIQLIDKLRVTI